MIVSLLVGAIAYYAKYNSEIAKLKHYDYSKQDSLFWNSAKNTNQNKLEKKKVDYEEELYDFSDNELESIRTKININSASVKELKTLPGIGEKTAQKVVSFRKKNGSFHSIKDLTKVRGIGKKKLEKIKKYIFVE